MKSLLLIGMGMTLVLLAPIAWRAVFEISRGDEITVASQGPTVERLQRLAHLVTTRVYVADVLTAEGEGHRGAWLIKGDAIIGVDLGRAQVIREGDLEKRATIHLPRPVVLQSRVDHDRTKTWEVQKTTWVPWGGDQDKLRDGVMLHAQRLVAQAAGSDENLHQARRGAEAVIRGFYAEVGWEVDVSWEDAPANEAEPIRASPAPLDR